MLDVRLFRIGAFSGASGSIALVFFALFGSIFFLTQYLQGVHGLHRARGGRSHAARSRAGLVVGGPLSAKLAERFGNRLVVAAGLTIAGPGCSCWDRSTWTQATAWSPPRWRCSESGWAAPWPPPPSRS